MAKEACKTGSPFLILALTLTLAALLVLLPGCGEAAPVEEPAPTPAATVESRTPASRPAATPEPEATSPPEEEGEEEEAAADGNVGLDEIVTTRTPVPTATPGPLAQEVNRVAARVGLARATFLGLSVADWLNLAISALFVLAGYLIGTWLIRGLLPGVVRRTPTDLDDAILEAFGPDLRRLVVVLTLHFATQRLTFFSVELKSFLGDIYFVIGLAIALHVVWRLIDLVHAQNQERLKQEGRLEELDPFLVLLKRVAHIFLAVISLSIFLSRFGINVSALAAALGIGGLALSLAAQDTLSDAIAGFLILADRPFRVGDRIEIQGLGTWGDVVEIGLRTTHIRTRDNRMVIVPNSTVGSNQVINYTYPDPHYRIETHVGIGYGTDIETARRIIVDTVRRVEGVLPGRPVDALYNEMGDTAMIFRVRWWIESYVDTPRVIDRVHTALQETLDAAGVDMPFPTQRIVLVREGGGVTREE